MANSHKVGRNAETGQFTTVKQAQQQHKTHVVETIKHQPAKPASQPSKKK